MNFFVFPGQGSQQVGMGSDAFSFSKETKEVFLEANDAISMNLSDLIFNGTEEDLKKTENAQVALMTVSIAYLKVLEHMGVSVSRDCSFVAGHSLGEYTALCAAGVLSLSDTAKLLRIRGEAMRDCCLNGFGMQAVIGLTLDKVEELIDEINHTEFIEIANDNSDAQVVVSGSNAAMEIMAEKAKAAGTMKTVLLNVAGPFHSSMMQPAADKLAEVLESATFNEPICPIISNYTASKETSNFKELLLKQIVNRVRWRESMVKAVQYGVTDLVEIGAGKVLTGLAKRTIKGVNLHNVNSVETAEAFAKSILGN